ncbi:hypothetical protein FB595_109107 [Sphingobium sp. AEW010]|nr:hypothetical protein [Sphingobium sp. JAI105]TWD05747.1 hypothetical protein FB595_109107 [Sphingobium sp. AEW010]TWD23300.1 hypothetical protein FB596_109107 [Sphingobium sp. AEW013]TWD25160.1 hypothetical protein FB594_109107 [Sphingobium sp. AEW001]
MVSMVKRENSDDRTATPPSRRGNDALPIRRAR